MRKGRQVNYGTIAFLAVSAGSRPFLPQQQLSSSLKTALALMAQRGSRLPGLSQQLPGPYDRVEEIVAMIRGAEQHHSGRCSIEKIRFTNASAEPWTVPRPLIPQWEAGLVTGWSYERGLSFVWERLAFDAEDVRKAIWREQVAGLMPTIIEIGMLANWMNIQVNKKAVT